MCLIVMEISQRFLFVFETFSGFVWMLHLWGCVCLPVNSTSSNIHKRLPLTSQSPDVTLSEACQEQLAAGDRKNRCTQVCSYLCHLSLNSAGLQSADGFLSSSRAVKVHKAIPWEKDNHNMVLDTALKRQRIWTTHSFNLKNKVF